MALGMYAASIPAYQRQLGALSKILEKGAAWAAAKKVDEAVLGAKVKVPTPEGPVMLTIPKGATSGNVLRLKGRGFTDKAGKRGDQLVNVQIDLPSGNPELEEFAQRWQDDCNPRAALGV